MIVEIVSGITGQHHEAGPHCGCFADIVGDYWEGIIIRLAGDKCCAIWHGSVIEYYIVKILLIGIRVRLRVQLSNIAFGR